MHFCFDIAVQTWYNIPIKYCILFGSYAKGILTETHEAETLDEIRKDRV